MNSHLALTAFREIFTGNEHSFGHHIYGTFEEGKKENGGKSLTVIDQLLTPRHYQDHLDGVKGLGIVPITADNKCKFAVIDIDVYERGREQTVIDAISKHDLPLCVFKSKSGGYHIYIFFNEFVAAKSAVEIANRYIRLLSIDIICTDGKKALEVFPKQITLQKGSKGNWINLPYYAGDGSRQAMLIDGQPVSLEEALTIISTKKRRTLKEHEAYIAGLAFGDAPPCLQSLYFLGAVDDNRNNFLFSFGVYLQKKDEDNFEKDLYELNRSLISPLPEKELEATVIQSIRKKAYSYKCKENPCITYCNKKECKHREYGLGGGGHVSELEFGQLYQIEIDPPYYEWVINGTKIRFKDEDEILNQHIFRKKCFRILHHTPYRLKDDEWIKILNSSLAGIIVVEEDQNQISPMAMLHEYVREFIMDTAQASSKDHISMSRPYNDTKNARYLFRGKDLLNFLYQKRRFTHYTQSEIHAFLRDNGSLSLHIRGESGRTMRVFSLPHEYFAGRGETPDNAVIEMRFTAEDIAEQVANAPF